MKRKGLCISPVDLGMLAGVEKSVFTLRQNQGTKIDAPCFAWVVLGGEKNIMVDSGPCSPAHAEKYHDIRLEKRPSQEIRTALKKTGLSPKDIDIVILTHLHWDHCFNLEQFEEATILVQNSELEYAVNPLPADRKAYEAGIPGILPPWMNVFGRIQPVDGDREIIPGVRVVHLPGHTPGSQGVIVETMEGPWIIASDTVPLYENWDDNDASKRVPSGLYQNLFDYYETLDRIGSFGASVLPGHDRKVLEHPVFPPG